MLKNLPKETCVTPRIEMTDLAYTKGNPADWDKVEGAIFRLKGVKTVCLNHCCWVELELFEGSYKQLDSLLADTRAKIERIWKRYSK